MTNDSPDVWNRPDRTTALRHRDSDRVTFGDLLRELRLGAGPTQEELAERARLSDRAVRALERGQGRLPRLQTVRLLAQGLALDDGEQKRLLDAARPSRGDRIASPDVTTLPTFLTRVVGRGEDVALVKLMLEERRLVTLTGPGGVGKTRLALLVAEQMTGEFTRLCFVELAPFQDPGHVAGAIARSLSLRERPGQSLFDLIVSALDTGRTLMVLDNMEHLLAARELVLSLLGACPHLSVLITSREALHVRGERVYTVGPLQLPERQADIGRSSAVQLFLERARDAGTEPAQDSESVAAVAEICRRVDGLPLAIELAAAWAPMLSPSALLSRLVSRVPLLDHGPEDSPPHQRTMRAAIAWSYDLLSPEEQALFARLSVLSGSWTLDAAEAVCDGVGSLDISILDAVLSLLDKSLLTVQQQHVPDAMGEPRFGMLETVKEFAWDQLVIQGDADAARRSHAEYFLALAEQAQSNLAGPEQSAWLVRLEQEHDNLRAALRTAHQSNDIGLGPRLIAALWPFWLSRSHFEEAREWLDDFVPRSETTDVSPADRANGLFAAGALVAFRKGDNKGSIVLLRKALALAKRSGNEQCAAAALNSLGGTECARGNFSRAGRLFSSSLAIYRRLGDRSGICTVLSASAGVARFQGEYERSAILYEEALAIARAIDDAGRVADILARLGSMVTEQGRPSEAQPYYDEALDLFRKLGNTFGIADVLLRSGETATAMGDYDRAKERLEESLRLYRTVGTKYGVAYVLLHQGEAAIGAGDFETAEALAAESLALFREIDDDRCVAFAVMQLGDVAEVHGDHEKAMSLYKQSLILHRKLNTRPEIARCLTGWCGWPVCMDCQSARSDCMELPRLFARAWLPRWRRQVELSTTRAWRRCARILETTGFAQIELEGQAMGLDNAVGYALAEDTVIR